MSRVTITEDHQETTVRLGARPIKTLISAQRVSVASMIDIALTERVMDGTLPYVWARYSTQTGEFWRLEEGLDRYLPIDAVVDPHLSVKQVLRGICGRKGVRVAC